MRRTSAPPVPAGLMTLWTECATGRSTGPAGRTQPWSKRRQVTPVPGVAISLLASSWTSSLSPTVGGAPAGVQTFQVSQRTHVAGTVSHRSLRRSEVQLTDLAELRLLRYPDRGPARCPLHGK